jgi:hypothetical protein
METKASLTAAEKATLRKSGPFYAEQATRTELKSYEPVLERFVTQPDKLAILHQLLRGSKDLGQQQDRFKRALFYGKPTHSGDFVSVACDLSAPTLYTYTATNKHTAAAMARLNSPQVIRLVHAAIGLQTEASELQEHLYDVIYGGKEIDPVNVVEEGGDVSWYLAIAITAIKDLLSDEKFRAEHPEIKDMDPFDYLVLNIEKLRARYPDKFSMEQALNRDLTAERKALEGETVPPTPTTPVVTPPVPELLTGSETENSEALKTLDVPKQIVEDLKKDDGTPALPETEVNKVVAETTNTQSPATDSKPLEVHVDPAVDAPSKTVVSKIEPEAAPKHAHAAPKHAPASKHVAAKHAAPVK